MAKRKRIDGMTAKWRRFRTAYLAGWDSALIQPELAQCPYHRYDFKSRWYDGRRECLSNKPLPDWVLPPICRKKKNFVSPID